MNAKLKLMANGRRAVALNALVLALLLVIFLVGLMLLATGCRYSGGGGGSFHRTERWNATPAGKVYLAERETWKDKNRLNTGGVLASADATAVATSRTNFLGTASKTTIGKYGDKPEPEAIKASGAAAGQIIGEAVKATVKP